MLHSQPWASSRFGIIKNAIALNSLSSLRIIFQHGMYIFRRVNLSCHAVSFLHEASMVWSYDKNGGWQNQDFCFCIPIVFGCPNKIKQEGDGTPYVCPRCNNAQVVEAKSRMWLELCWIPVVCTDQLCWMLTQSRFHAHLSTFGYAVFANGKFHGTADTSPCLQDILCRLKCNTCC